MVLVLAKPAFNSFGMHLKVGVKVHPIQWSGDWLQVAYPVNPLFDVYFWFHKALIPDYFGVPVEILPADLPCTPPVQDSAPLEG